MFKLFAIGFTGQHLHSLIDLSLLPYGLTAATGGYYLAASVPSPSVTQRNSCKSPAARHAISHQNYCCPAKPSCIKLRLDHQSVTDSRYNACATEIFISVENNGQSTLPYKTKIKFSN
ncbi:MAG: hypothetical protein ACXWAB_11545 [Methylobacter sp.]